MSQKVTQLDDQGSVMVSTTADTPAKTKEDYSGIDSLGSLLDTVPALRSLLDKAIAGNWSPSRFQNAVQDSTWWKSHSDTARQIIIQRANDPAAFQQSLHNTTGSIMSLSKQLGFAIDSKTAAAIANHALLTGNGTNQQWLTSELGHHQDYTKVKTTDGLSGQMAGAVSQLQQMAADYGMSWTPAQIAHRAQMVVDGDTTMDTWKNRLTNWAKSAFPALAKDIEGGATVKDLADPYMQSMSQLLEVTPGSLNLYTPAIRRALQGTQDPKTKERTTMNLSDFEDQVRNDPRWQYTQNAKDTMSSALLKLGADFGFGPEG